MPMIEVPPSQQFPGMTGRYQPSLADTEFAPPPPNGPTYGDEGVVEGGAAIGAVGGAIAGGPIGAVIGGGLGAAAGGFLRAPPEAQQGAIYNNDVARAYRLLTKPTFVPDPTYDVSEDADVIGPESKYQGYLDQFVGSQSRAETQSIMSGIDRQNAADKAVHDAGWLGILAQAASGAASPLTLLPIEGVIGIGADVGRTALLLRRGAEAAGLGGVYGAAQGGLAQATNPNATFQDTINQTLLSAALTGVLGGAAGLLKPSEVDALRDGLVHLSGGGGGGGNEGGGGVGGVVQNPLDAVAVNSRLAAAGVAEADRADFAAAYARVADQYQASIAELESIRLEAGQPTTAPEYVAEATRLAEQRDQAVAELDRILHEYPTTGARPGIETTEPTGRAATEPTPIRTAGTATPPAVGETVASEAFPKPVVQNAAPAAEAATGAERGVSKIGKSIETKAVDARLTNGFEGTAGYDKITIKDQAERATNLVNANIEKARAIVRGEEPLPSGLHGTSLITAMEEHLAKNPSAAIAHELANSPLVSATSAAAQSLRLAAERAPDSIAARFQAIKDARMAAIAKRAGTGAVQKAVRDIRGSIVANASKRPTWTEFIKAIEC